MLFSSSIGMTDWPFDYGLAGCEIITIWAGHNAHNIYLTLHVHCYIIFILQDDSVSNIKMEHYDINTSWQCCKKPIMKVPDIHIHWVSIMIIILFFQVNW